MTDADDKESVDRAFAELVAGFHLTADRPEPPKAAHDEWDGPPTGRTPAPARSSSCRRRCHRRWRHPHCPRRIRSTNRTRNRWTASNPSRRHPYRDPPGPYWSVGSVWGTPC